MAYHMMLDGETFATSNNAVMPQLGWVVFDPEGEPGSIIDHGEYNISVDSCLALGGQVDGSTLRWWMTDAPAVARALLFDPQAPVWQMPAVLSDLRSIYSQHGCRGVWSHGLTFDIAIINGYYQRLWPTQQGNNCPWKFWDCRDTRTRFADAERLTSWRRPKRETAHTGLADARVQAEDVQSSWAAMRELFDFRRASLDGVAASHKMASDQGVQLDPISMRELPELRDPSGQDDAGGLV